MPGYRGGTDHQIQSDQESRLMQNFTDVVAFSESQSPAYLHFDSFQLDQDKIKMTVFLTGVPVDGATEGSKASTSKLR